MRLKLGGSNESFRAKEKPLASRKMNAFIFRSVQRFFAVRPRTAGYRVIQAAAGSRVSSKKRGIRSRRVQGGAPTLAGARGQRPRRFFQAAAGSCVLSKTCSIRSRRVQGGAPTLAGARGQRPRRFFQAAAGSRVSLKACSIRNRRVQGGAPTLAGARGQRPRNPPPGFFFQGYHSLKSVSMVTVNR